MAGNGQIVDAGPVVCVSYLAAAELWTVPQFPRLNHGVEVRSAEQSIAADAPMAAATLSALGVSSLLLCNDIGEDQRGKRVQKWLQRHRVSSTCAIGPDTVTPWITVIADGAATRTWFAHLPDAASSLAQADLASLDSASRIYLDCYQVIEEPAIRVVQASASTGVPLLVNLADSEPSTAVLSAMLECPDLVIQANVDDDEHDTAYEVAASLLTRTGAAWVVVTAGTHGALAMSETETVSVPAFQIHVRHTHCAGAAFSGGMLYGLQAGLSMVDAMMLGSASGALRCAMPHSAPLPTLAVLQELIRSGLQIGFRNA